MNLLASIFIFIVFSRLATAALYPNLLHLIRGHKVREKRIKESFHADTYESRIENVDYAIDQASSVVVIIFSDGILVSKLQSTSNNSDVLRANEDIVGVSGINELSAGLYLVVTGFGGDCREAIHFAKELVINGTFMNGFVPHGALVAKDIAKLFQASTMGSERPFACHALVCDCRPQVDLPHTSDDGSSTNEQGVDRLCVFEIHPTGALQVVRGSVMGRGAGGLGRPSRPSAANKASMLNTDIASGSPHESGYECLERGYRPNLNLPQAKALAETVLARCGRHALMATFSMQAAGEGDSDLSLCAQDDQDIQRNVTHVVLPFSAMP